jgi:hypothetical protein
MKTRTTTNRSWSTRALVLSMAALLLALFGATSQTANAELPDYGDGWIRVAHLSPDTTAVDVTVASVSGSEDPFTLEDVEYGTVSDYRGLPQGTYVLSMTPSDAAADSAPVISSSIDIVEGKAVTVAAYGANADLQAKVFQDDLDSPKKGEASIRLIQASTRVDAVDVQTSTGTLIASGAAAGEATSYASVPAGEWDLELSATAIADSASVKLKKGSVNTLFVLDNAAGGLTIKSVLDSSDTGDTPAGGVNTGGGFLGSRLGFDE